MFENLKGNHNGGGAGLAAVVGLTLVAVGSLALNALDRVSRNHK
jgi:hypothetical protein